MQAVGGHESPKALLDGRQPAVQVVVEGANTPRKHRKSSAYPDILWFLRNLVSGQDLIRKGAPRGMPEESMPPERILRESCLQDCGILVTTANEIRQRHGLVSEPSTWRTNQRSRIMIWIA